MNTQTIRRPVRSTIEGFAHPVLGLVCLLAAACASAPKSFDTPEAATDALVAALRANDDAQLSELLGDEGDDMLSSGDAVADQRERAKFLELYAEEADIVVENGEAILVVGRTAWPLPMPLVQHGDKWSFDIERGKDEILSRRIGRNELSAIQVCHAIADAQIEYAELDLGGRGKAEFASRIISASGKKDGLFWPTSPGEPVSPLGPLVAEAKAGGYTRGAMEAAERPAYHGYCFRILTAQGPSGPGGARGYMVDGRMTGGFAVLAEPATYGNSGVMTFLVGPFGVVYQRDLGEDTTNIAADIEAFDPGPEWSLVQD